MNPVKATTTPPATPEVPARLKKAAQDFEALLIGTLLRSLEQSFGDLGGESSLAGEQDYQYLGTEALSAAVSQRGGLGIADSIVRNLRQANHIDPSHRAL